MKKKILSVLTVLPIVIPFLASCSSLHVHTFTSPYETDEESHWKTCSICHQKFDQHNHVFNEINDKCSICDYTDPLVYLNEDNEVIGLTPYGKTKYTINLPENVWGIGHEAFKDSEAVTVKLNKELNYYYDDSFTGSHVKNITTEESIVEWDYQSSEGKITKKRVLNDNVAKIGNNYYETLDEAFAAVDIEDTTITLLRDRYDLLTSAPIEVDHSIILEPLYPNTMLTCNFNIANNGILYIPETITYVGSARLLLTHVKELVGNGADYADFNNIERSAYSTGSIVFVNKDECPAGADVSYVASFKEIRQGIPARGAKQVANELLLIPHKHYAFGTVRFSTDFTTIWGLTKYGETVTELTLTSPFEGINCVVGRNAFSVGYRIHVSISDSPDINVYSLKTKGFFTDLTIGEGITAIKEYAFNNRIDDTLKEGIDISDKIKIPGLVEVLPILFSHLFSVKLGDDLKTIGEMAFYDNVSMTNVVGGANLTSIGSEAFGGGISLTTADFSHSYKLKEIERNAFTQCSSLSYLALPPGQWKCGGTSYALGAYFPFDMTPEGIANIFASDEEEDGSWQKTNLSSEPIYYTFTKVKDKKGRFCCVVSTDSIETALSKCPDKGEIYISEGYEGSHTIDLDRSKSLTIRASSEFKDFTVTQQGQNDITINPGQYLMLNNVRPEGNITLKADSNSTTGGTINTAGFAIKGVDSSDIPQVSLDSTNVKVGDLLSTTANIDRETYDAYGIFNFAIKEDEARNEQYTLINDTSPFGDKATSITFARQTNEVPRVVAGIDNTTITLDNNITHINISSDVEKIAQLFFKNFDDLEKVICEEGLKTIGARAFEGCDNLKSINLPNSITSIGYAAFNSCDNLTMVSIPNNEQITSISKQCFRACTSLTSIVIPATVTSIGEEAFAGCKELKTVSFPVNLETIEKGAFSGCEALNSIYIPDDSHLKTIGENAFGTFILGDDVLKCGLAYAYFANNTEGWTVPESTAIPASDLTDPSLAALRLTTTYVDKQWTRSV